MGRPKFFFAKEDKDNQERGAKIIDAPENKDWGIREMIVEDPDGHRIRIGTRLGEK